VKRDAVSLYASVLDIYRHEFSVAPLLVLDHCKKTTIKSAALTFQLSRRLSEKVYLLSTSKVGSRQTKSSTALLK
jgi:hypothetical protein